MAEPMSSKEIEDVLSSIRRLVAQDLKPGDRAKLAAIAQATQKLVLTPESRVENSPSSQVAGFATVRRPSRRAILPSVDAVLADVSGPAHSAPIHDINTAKRTVTPAAAPQFSLGQEAEILAALQAPQESNGANHAPAPDQVALNGGGQAAHFADLTPADQNAEIAAADHIEFADDPVRIDPQARMGDVDRASLAAAHNAQRSPWPDHEPEELSDDAFSASFETDAARGLQGTIEPDSAWADEVEAKVIAELSHQAQDGATDDAFGGPDHGPAPKFQGDGAKLTFDEEELRSMVRNIFREEMAGPLGERITRNIRKLVRSEVNRILAAQEFE